MALANRREKVSCRASRLRTCSRANLLGRRKSNADGSRDGGAGAASSSVANA